MKLSIKPISQINQEALAVLSREIGIADTIRFINQFTTGHGNYTEERRTLFAGMSLDEILSEMRNKQAE